MRSTILRIMTLHLTKKNAWIWISGVCIVFLAAIGVLVPSDQWGLPPWKWVILVLVVFSILGLTITLFSQSKEDHDREETERKREATQNEIMAQLATLLPKRNEEALKLTVTT